MITAVELCKFVSSDSKVRASIGTSLAINRVLRWTQMSVDPPRTGKICANICLAIYTCYEINGTKLNANFDCTRKIASFTVILCDVIKSMYAKIQSSLLSLFNVRFYDFYLS